MGREDCSAAWLLLTSMRSGPSIRGSTTFGRRSTVAGCLFPASLRARQNHVCQQSSQSELHLPDLPTLYVVDLWSGR